MRRNVYTGDHFDIAIIDKAGFREVSEQEKEKLLGSVRGTQLSVWRKRQIT